jgi:predicted alpha/beta-hydrolase family hydrolase
MNVVKFPYEASRRVHSRRPRTSKTALPKSGQVSLCQVKDQNLADAAIHSERKSSRCLAPRL